MLQEFSPPHLASPLPHLQAYRRFRRNFLALRELERRLAVDLHAARERSGNEGCNSLILLLLAESCRALTETANEALDGLRSISSTLPTEIGVDSGALLRALTQALPDLEEPVQRAIIEHMDQHGGAKRILGTIEEYLRDKIQRYRAGEQLLCDQGSATDDSLEAASSTLFPPSLSFRAHASEPEAIARLSRKILDATSKAERKLKQGVAYPVALAERELLAAELASRDPSAAVKLGVYLEPVEPQPLLCLVFGFGWAVCVVVLLVAVSSHNVDDGDDDGDSTTG